MSKELQVFTFPINCGLTFGETAGASNQNWIDPDITEQHFPALRNTKNAGIENVEACLVHFNREIGPSQIVTQPEWAPYEMGSLRDLLAFTAAYPDEQCTSRIIAPYSVWRRGFGDVLVPILWHRQNERFLSLHW